MTRLEKDIKKQVEDYLTYKQNQGKLIFFRLNTGDIIIQGEKTRRFKGCGITGASDLLVIRARTRSLSPRVAMDYSENIFIECKSDTGKQTPAQRHFQKLVEEMGCQYILARKLEDVSGVI